MFELEYLVAFAFGAGLVAITPVAASVAGRESKLTKTISGAGRGITKQGLKLGIVVGSKASGLFSGVKSGLSEVGESFGDILAEAKADLAESKRQNLQEPLKLERYDQTLNIFTSSLQVPKELEASGIQKIGAKGVSGVWKSAYTAFFYQKWSV